MLQLNPHIMQPPDLEEHKNKVMRTYFNNKTLSQGIQVCIYMDQLIRIQKVHTSLSYSIRKIKSIPNLTTNKLANRKSETKIIRSNSRNG